MFCIYISKNIRISIMPRNYVPELLIKRKTSKEDGTTEEKEAWQRFGYCSSIESAIRNIINNIHRLAKSERENSAIQANNFIKAITNLEKNITVKIIEELEKPENKKNIIENKMLGVHDENDEIK